MKSIGGIVGGAIEKNRHRLSGRYDSRDDHSINVGYVFEYSNKISMAVEHIQKFGKKTSDTIVVSLWGNRLGIQSEVYCRRG